MRHAHVRPGIAIRERRWCPMPGFRGASKPRFKLHEMPLAAAGGGWRRLAARIAANDVK